MLGMGAICCDGVQACTAGWFAVQAGECQRDICCSGNRSCEDSTFTGGFPSRFIRNQRCDGIDACKGGVSSFVSGDLTCNGMAACENRWVQFIRRSNAMLTHAITCTGENACRCEPNVTGCQFDIFDFIGVAWCQGNRAISVFQGDLWVWVKTCQNPVPSVTLKSLLNRWFLTYK